MQRYPALAVYRGILLIGGWLTIFGGVLFVVSVSSRSYYGFNLGEFLLGSIPFIVGGGALIVISEIISLFVNIETRLIEIRDVDRRRMTVERESASSYNEPKETVSPELPLAHLKKLWESGDKVVMPIGTIVANHNQVVIEAVATTDYLLLRDIPNPTAKPVKKILLGEEVNVIGVSQDFNWFLLRDTFNKLYWARSTGLTLQGDVSMLPVVSL